MISEFMWRSRFDAATATIIGKAITLDSSAAHHRRRTACQRSVPICRPDRHLDATLFRVLAHDPAAAADGRRLSRHFGAAAAGHTTAARADAELAVLNRQYREQNPTAPDADPAVEMTADPLRDLVVADVRGKVLMLTVSVAGGAC